MILDFNQYKVLVIFKNNFARKNQELLIIKYKTFKNEEQFPNKN